MRTTKDLTVIILIRETTVKFLRGRVTKRALC